LEQDSWEVVEGLRGEMNYTQEPPIQKGFLLKKRKWPLKGWHKVRTGLGLTFVPTFPTQALFLGTYI